MAKAKVKAKSKAKSKKGSAAAPKAATARVGDAAAISANALKALLRADDSYAEQISGLTGELRAEIKEAVEKKRLDKTAYAMLKRFHRMTPEKAAVVWANLNYYMDISGVMAEIEAQPDLPMAGEAEAKDDSDGGDKNAAETPPAEAADGPKLALVH